MKMDGILARAMQRVVGELGCVDKRVKETCLEHTWEGRGCPQQDGPRPVSERFPRSGRKGPIKGQEEEQVIRNGRRLTYGIGTFLSFEPLGAHLATFRMGLTTDPGMSQVGQPGSPHPFT